MKRQTLARAGIFAVTLAITGLGMGAGAAHAGVITLDVSAIMFPTPGHNCIPTGCQLGGDIVIDNTAGTFVSADVTLGGGATPHVGPFTSFASLAPSAGITEMTIDADASAELDLFFATPTAGSLVGYIGGPLSSATIGLLPTGSGQLFRTPSGGSLTCVPVGSPACRTPVSVPEPASLLLLASALACAGTLLGRRSLSN